MGELREWLPLVPALRRAQDITKTMADKITTLEQQMARLQLSMNQPSPHATTQRKVIQNISHHQQVLQQDLQRLKKKKEHPGSQEVKDVVHEAKGKVIEAIANS